MPNDRETNADSKYRHYYELNSLFLLNNIYSCFELGPLVGPRTGHFRKTVINMQVACYMLKRKWFRGHTEVYRIVTQFWPNFFLHLFNQILYFILAKILFFYQNFYFSQNVLFFWPKFLFLSKFICFTKIYIFLPKNLF